MKLLCSFTFLLGHFIVAGFEEPAPSSLQYSPLYVNKIVLVTIMKNAYSGRCQEIFTEMEPTIISNCKINDSQTINSLHMAYLKMRFCLRKKRIFVASITEFLDNFEECSRDVITKASECLEEKHKYFPEFLLEVVKSATNFLYDDRDYESKDIVPCLTNLSYQVQMDYDQCINSRIVAADIYGNEIPNSKKALCRSYRPTAVFTSFCFRHMMEEGCNSTIDYYHYNDIIQPCQSKAETSKLIYSTHIVFWVGIVLLSR